MNRRIASRVLFVLSLLLLVLPIAAQDAPTAGQDLQEALDRLGRRPPPAPFGDAESEELGELQRTIDERRRGILRPGTELSNEEIAALAAEITPLVKRIDELSAQRRQWESFQRNPEGAWWRDAEATIPILSAAAPDRREPFYRQGYYLLLKRFQRLELATTSRSTVTPDKYGIEGSPPDLAIALARDFELCARGRLELGGESPLGCYRLRSALLQARCLLIAAHWIQGTGDVDAVRALWEEAIEVLHSADLVFKAAEARRVDLAPLDLLPPITADDLDLMRRVYHEPLPVFAWDERTPSIGSLGRMASQEPTSVGVRRILAQVCPWGVPVWRFLKDQGLTEGLDLRILGYLAGLQPEKVWVGGLGPASIPPSVRAEIDEIRKGNLTVNGQPLHLEWESIQGTNELTVWFVSPAVRDMTAGQFLGLCAKAVTIAKCGLVSLGMGLAGDVAGAAIDAHGPDSPALPITVGVVAEAMPWEYDQVEGFKREGFSPGNMLKGGLLKVLDQVEKAEIESLFDGLDPTNGRISRALGGQRTYDGSWMPPVILRACIVGQERTSDKEYRRRWLITRYWALDPRGLSLDEGAWDLSRLLVDRLPGEAAYRAGSLETSKRTWWPLPDAGGGEKWGGRVRVIGFEPVYQHMDVTIAPEVEKRWRDECPDDHGLVFVFRYPPPLHELVDVFPLGQPIDFSNQRVRKVDVAFEGSHFRRKIYCEYDVHVMRAPRASDGKSFEVNSPRAVELARFPLRFVNKGGKKPTGEITYHDVYPWVFMKYTWTGEVDREFELDPSGGDGPLIPPAIVLQREHSNPEVPLRPHLLDDRYYALTCGFGPVEKGQWVRLNVRVENPNLQYPREYVLHDRCRVRAGIAYFRSNIPLGVGRNRITLEVPGQASRSFLVDRDPPRAREPVDAARFEESIRKHREKRDRATDERGRLYAHEDVLHAKVHWARKCLEREQYGNARDLLYEVAPAWPDPAAIRRCDLGDSYQDCREDYLQVLTEVTFFQGDARGLGEAVPALLALEREYVARKISEGRDGWDNSYYAGVAAKYDKQIDRLLLLDADLNVIRPLVNEWHELRRLCGRTEVEFDAERFRHPELIR